MFGKLSSIRQAAEPQRNKRFVLVLAPLTFAFTRVLPISCMPVLFKEISEELGLDLVQIGSLWGIIMLGSIIVMPLGGLLCDRLGVKRTLVLVCFLAGVTGALRGFSADFVSLMATTFLWGLVSSASVPAVSIGASFSVPRERQGLAQGAVATGGGLGNILGPLISATFLSPWLGGWRNVLFLYGGISIIIGLLWLFAAKEPQKIKTVDSQGPIQLRQAFLHLVHIRAIWILGLTMLAYNACIQGMAGFLPLYLRGNGWLAAAADGTLAVFSGIGTIVVMPLALLSDVGGSRKLGLFASFAITAVCVGLLSVIHSELVWVLVAVAGIFSAVTPSLLTATCIETKEVGVAFAGTSVGMVTAIANIGWVIAPPIGNSLASIKYGLPFIFWAALAVCGLVVASFIKETGWRASKVH